MVRTGVKPMRGRTFKLRLLLIKTGVLNLNNLEHLVFCERLKPFTTLRKKYGSYLVDPASSHMLVSKIKPCMSKYKYYTAKLQTAH